MDIALFILIALVLIAIVATLWKGRWRLLVSGLKEAGLTFKSMWLRLLLGITLGGLAGLQAVGVFCLSIVTGLVAYQSPPTSLGELGTWLWQPAMQGLMMSLGVMGITAGMRPREK